MPLHHKVAISWILFSDTFKPAEVIPAFKYDNRRCMKEPLYNL